MYLSGSPGNIRMAMKITIVTPIKVGIPLRVYLYHRIVGLDTGTGAALVAIETLLGLLTAGLAATAGIAFVFDEVSLYLPVTLCTLVVLGAMVLLIVPDRLAPFLRVYIPQYHLTHRVADFLARVEQGYRRVPLWAVLLLSLIHI